MDSIKTKQNFTSIFLIGFIFSFSIAVSTYVNSTFLSTFISEKLVGLFYIFSSILTILLMIKARSFLNKFGNYKVTLWALITNLVMLLLLAFWNNFYVVAVSLIIHLVAVVIIFFNIDVFLEAFSSDKETGSIRGGFLSLSNLAWLISPAIAGFILSDNEYWKIYLFSAMLMFPLIYILVKNLKKFKDPHYVKSDLLNTLKEIYKRKNVAKIFWAQFLLRFFYSWMVIYMPIYLHDHVGFEWGAIGIIFTFMLLPFVLLEMPLGKLADKKLGEKEILNFGFLIAGVSTATLTFITSQSIVLWALLLFMTRVGASMIEIASETYFFKKIDGDDTNILSIFRMARPFAYVLGPIVVTVLLMFIEINYLFIILGGIIGIGGIVAEMGLKDTK